MVIGVIKKVLGLDPNERELKRLSKIVARINELEPEMENLSDEELASKTVEFKERLSRGATLDDILIEAFAVVREVAKRTIGLRHFDVQLMGGIVLHEGKIAEMKTGEGKTLVATLPVYLIQNLGRKEIRGEAVMTLCVDEPVPPEVLDKIKTIEGFERVDFISL